MNSSDQGTGWLVRVERIGGLLLLAVVISCNRPVTIAPGPAAPVPSESGTGLPGDRRDNYGVGVDQAPNLPQAALQRLFGAAREAHIRWGRLHFDREEIHRGQGLFDWTATDRLVTTAATHGVQLLAILGATPRWDTTGPLDNPAYTGYPPRSYDQWADYVFRTVSRYRDRVQHWEIWNEPDGGPDGDWRGSPAQYARLLAVAYREIKRADSGAKVLLGGIIMDDLSFLRRIMADRTYPAGSHFDIMNIHAYGTLEEVRARFTRIRPMSTRPIWVTEMGWPSDPDLQTDPEFCCGEEGKALYLTTVMTELRALGAEKVFWWTLWLPDESEAPVPLGDFATYGLLDTQMMPTAAYFAIRDLLANLPE